MSSLEDSDGRIALLCSLKSRDLWLLVPRTSGRECETKKWVNNIYWKSPRRWEGRADCAQQSKGQALEDSAKDVSIVRVLYASHLLHTAVDFLDNYPKSSGLHWKFIRLLPSMWLYSLKAISIWQRTFAPSTTTRWFVELAESGLTTWHSYSPLAERLVFYTLYKNKKGFVSLFIWRETHALSLDAADNMNTHSYKRDITSHTSLNMNHICR